MKSILPSFQKNRIGITVILLFLTFNAAAQPTWWPAQGSANSPIATPTTTATVNKASGIVAGDLILLIISWDTHPTSATITPPTGFTLIATAGTTATPRTSIRAYYKFAGLSEPASYTITWVGNRHFVAACNRITGADPSAPIGATSSLRTAVGNTNSISLPGFNAQGNSLLVAAFTTDVATASITVPADMTQKNNFSNTNLSYATALDIDGIPSATGTKTFSWTTTASVGSGIFFEILSTNTDNDVYSDFNDLDNDNDGIKDVDEGCRANVGIYDAKLGFLFQGNPSSVYTVNFSTGVSTLVRTFSQYYNAVAYNDDDDRFWAFDLTDGGRISLLNPGNSTWPVTSTINTATFTTAFAGGYSRQDKRYVFSASLNIFVYNGNPASGGYRTFVKTFTSPVAFQDFAYNPLDNRFYGTQQASNNLYRIDINAETVTLLGVPVGLPLGAYGAIYTTLDGKLILSNNGTGDIYLINLAADPLFAINYSPGPNAGNNDGARSLDLNLQGECLLDTDLDGIPNMNDLDSDDDGCPDVIEGGGTFTNTDHTGGVLNGTVQTGTTTIGIPTSAGAGQSVGTSIVATRLVTVTVPPATITASTPGTYNISIVTRSENTSTFQATAPHPVYGTLGNNNANLRYQWYRGDPDAGGVALTNTAPYSGVTTATLSVAMSSNAQAGTYYVVGTVTNNECARVKHSTVILSTLPLNLISFNGTAQGCATVLNWQTTDEVNVSYFEIEQSIDGIVWNNKGKVLSQTTNNGVKNYNYTVSQENATSFYRLKIVDANLTFKYSSVLQVKTICNDKQNSIQIYPNPVAKSGLVTITLQGKYTGKAEVTLVDATGSKVISMQVQLNAGMLYTQKISFENLAKGLYMLQIVDNNGKRIYPVKKIINQ
jgi:hypothetical protein